MHERDVEEFKRALSQLPSPGYGGSMPRSGRRRPRRRDRTRAGTAFRPDSARGSERVPAGQENPTVNGSDELTSSALVPPPIPPQHVSLDRPFWIRVQDDTPTETLLDEHFEPGNSWAKIYLQREHDFRFCQLDFYFLWTNTNGADTSADVTTSLTVRATAETTAEPQWLPPVVGSGGTEVKADGSLYLLEWWNQPPTQPPWQPQQSQPIIDVTADAGWPPLPWSTIDDQWQSANASYNLAYEKFLVKRDQSAVLQVSLLVYLWSWNGSGLFDAGNGNNIVMCPSVNLELGSGPGKNMP